MATLEGIVLEPEHIGRWVEYSSLLPGSEQQGRIKGFNKQWVFVVYKCDNNWDRFEDYTGCATDPKDLRFLEVTHEQG
ncbi:MAG: hypothetical protein AMJ65_08215 [Phycisphaerae bacterium SG8_4]|nr:MAG: hypothetical protein AMJ65_08215 [Phycisphaerae bacterium SG8_4]